MKKVYLNPMTIYNIYMNIKKVYLNPSTTYNIHVYKESIFES